MENISFEKEVLKYLNLPSIPKKEWKEGDAPFDKGVAIVNLYGEHHAYAVCTCNEGEQPRIIKTFGIEPFHGIEAVFVVPNYMSNIEDVQDMDLDEESKKKAEEILKEAKEIEEDGTKNEENPMSKLPEWVFEEIHSKEEAEAWLKNWQSRNHQKGRIPTTEENIKLRLYSIYTELQNKTKVE